MTNRLDKPLFKSKLATIDWNSVLNEDEVNTSFNNFLSLFDKHYNDSVTLEKCNNYKKIPRQPWLNKSLLKCINKKDKLFYKYKKNPTDINKIIYTRYKNTLLSALRYKKKEYFTRQFNNYYKNIKGTWKVINNVLNKGNYRNITEMKIGDKIEKESQIVAEEFNKYFVNIGPNLAKDIASPQKQFHTFLRDPNSKSLFLNPTNEQEVMNIIKQLKNKSSFGFDNISNNLLKEIAPQIIKPLVYIFNLSIQTGTVPIKMKIAKVIPIFKKGDPLVLSNYRPISLLSCFSKILEKIIYERTVKFIKKQNIFFENQYGFREKHTTSQAVLSFIDKIASATDDHKHTAGILLDFSKAFDTIDHEILLYKLNHYGIRGRALEWFRSYLSDRQQYVYLNHCESSYKYTSCGVPQGSLLGPLLFLCYINDIAHSSKLLTFILFADDSTVLFSHKDPYILLATINNELIYLNNWIQANKLSLNLQKTHYMLFSSSLDNLPGQVVFNQTPIDRVRTAKFLGLFIDEHLNWNTHLVHLNKLISRNAGIIYKLKQFFPIKILLMLYSTLILPYLNYGIIVWGNSARSNIDKILKTQKRILRCIYGCNPRTHADPLFKKSKILKIDDLYLLNLGSLMHKMNNGELPDVLESLFKKNKEIHKYPTRQSDMYHIPKTRLRIMQNTLIFNGPKFWNSLQNELQQTSGFYTFKRKLKYELLSHYSGDGIN